MFQIEERDFSRKISLLDAVILGLGSTIGAGIFILLAPGIEIAGPGVIIAFALNAVIALIIAGNYAEAASFVPVQGGGFSFVEAAYGKKALFLGWIVWLGNTSYAALTAVGIGKYLSTIIPVHEVIISITVLVVFSLLNSVGSKSVASIEKPLIISLITAFIVTIVFLFTNPVDGGFTPLFPDGLWTLLPATSLLFITYTGFESITTISAEIKKPRTNIPKALFITIGLVSIIYLVTVASVLYAADYQRLGGSTIALVEAVGESPLMQGLITMAAVLAMLTSLNIGLMAGSRNVYALSRDGFLSKKWSSISERFQSPVKAVLLTFGVAVVLILTNHIDFIASISNIAFMLMVSSVGLAVLKFRKHEESTNYRLPLYPYTSYLCIGLPLILIPFLDYHAIIIGFGWLFIGILIYFFKHPRKPKT